MVELKEEEFQGLTFYGDCINAQVQGPYASDEYQAKPEPDIAIFIKPEVKQADYQDGVYMITRDDVKKLAKIVELDEERNV